MRHETWESYTSAVETMRAYGMVEETDFDMEGRRPYRYAQLRIPTGPEMLAADCARIVDVALRVCGLMSVYVYSDGKDMITLAISVDLPQSAAA